MFSKSISLLLFLTLWFCAHGQITVNSGTYDFGNIEKFNNDTAWFTLTNGSNRLSHLLPTQPSGNYEILTDRKSIPPGESMKMGIVYYTDEKGRFDFNVPVYFSTQSSAINLKVRGNIKSILPTALNTCPSIENSKPLASAQVPLNVTVRDKETNQLLTSVNISGKQNMVFYQLVPSLNGTVYSCKSKYGPLTLSASKTGYQPESLDILYDQDHYTFVIYLQKEVVKQIPDSTYKTYKPKPGTVVIRDSIAEPEYVPAIEEKTELNTVRYKPNHLVFIIDISGSMKDSGKLNYLKASMKDLIGIVRPQDRITLITYAYKVNLVFENYSGSDREAIFNAIDSLKAGGGSNGAASMQMAYEIALRHLIPDGNNQIFLATDGLFNSSKISDDDLYKLARKNYNQHEIKLSTIGFGKDQRALDFLKKLSELGHGNFLRIIDLRADLSVLKEEVKQQSLVK